MIHRTLAVIVLAWAVSSSSGAEPYRPRFRGPNGTGVSPATTVPASWTDKDYNWQVSLSGQGHSSSAISEGVMYPRTRSRLLSIGGK